MSIIRSVVLLLAVVSSASAQQKVKPVAVEPGVSYELAQYRKSVISNINYHLSFKIPANRNEPVTGAAGIRFDLSAVEQDLQIDFKQDAGHIKTVELVGGKLIPTVFEN